MSKRTRESREAAKARLEEERARQAAAERRRRGVFVAVGAVAVLAIVAAVLVAVQNENKTTATASSGPTPAIVSSNDGGDDGGVPFGPTVAQAKAAGIPTVDVYEDFQCPACKTFEDENRNTMQELATNKKARVVYHPINLIGSRQPQGLARSSSLRAASAMACATYANNSATPKGPKLPTWVWFHNVAFLNQPAEGTGITDDQLIEWGRAAGATSQEFKDCVKDQTYVGWAERVDAQSGDRNVTGTPTVFVNGKELKRQPNEYTPAGITAAVAAATKEK